MKYLKEVKNISDLEDIWDLIADVIDLGHYSVAKYLIESGVVEPNHGTLQRAIENGQNDLAILLLEKGIEALADHVVVAASSTLPEILDLLLTRVVVTIPKEEIAKKMLTQPIMVPRVEAFLEKYSLSLASLEGSMLLAAEAGCIEGVQWLLDHKVPFLFETFETLWHKTLRP